MKILKRKESNYYLPHPTLATSKLFAMNPLIKALKKKMDDEAKAKLADKQKKEEEERKLNRIKHVQEKLNSPDLFKLSFFELKNLEKESQILGLVFPYDLTNFELIDNIYEYQGEFQACLEVLGANEENFKKTDFEVLSLMKGDKSWEKIRNKIARLAENAGSTILQQLYPHSTIRDLNQEAILSNLRHLPSADLSVDDLKIDFKTNFHIRNFASIAPLVEDLEECTACLVASQIKFDLERTIIKQIDKISFEGIRRPSPSHTLKYIDAEYLLTDFVLPPSPNNELIQKIRSKFLSSSFFRQWLSCREQIVWALAKLGVFTPEETLEHFPYKQSSYFHSVLQNSPNKSLSSLRALLLDHSYELCHSVGFHKIRFELDHYLFLLRCTPYQITWVRGILMAINAFAPFSCAGCTTPSSKGRLRVVYYQARWIIQSRCPTCQRDTTIMAFCQSCGQSLKFSPESECTCGGIICDCEARACKRTCRTPTPIR